jgi:hypothetical protein
VSIAAVVLATSVSAQTGREAAPPTHPISINVFWIAYPFSSLAPAVANYVEAPAGSIAPFATGDGDYRYVVIHRVVGDFATQPGPYWTEVVTSWPIGRVVTAPEGVTITLHR